MTKLHADNIDIPSLTALLPSAPAAHVLDSVNYFAASVQNAKQRWSFSAVWTVRRTASTSANAPWKEDTRATTDHTVSLVRSDSLTKQSASNVSANVDLTDKHTVLLFTPVEFVPSTEDTVTYSGITYRVLSIKAIAPSNVVLFWEVSISQ